MADNLLSSRDNAIVYLAAQGRSTKEISEALGISINTASNALREERIQFEVKRMRHKLYGVDAKTVKKRFDDMVEDAQKVIQEILENPNSTIKPQLRFNAAQEVLDRSLGKPKQTVEHQGSLIRELFDRMDSPEASKVIDVHPVEEDIQELLGSGETTKPEAKKDDLDKFISEHL